LKFLAMPLRVTGILAGRALVSRRIGVYAGLSWIWISMDISMDIQGKSVYMDMDMDGKFHIHGKPA